jgi:CubicO group peptidase (beta-lactamase class C family)
MKSPFKYLIFLLAISSCTPENQNVRLGNEQQLGAIQIKVVGDSLDSWTQRYTPVGAEILIIKNGKIIMHEAYGWKNLEDSALLEKNSIFRLASMTKPITATGILKLHEDGKINITDNVSKYLPSFKEVANDSLTIEHIMRHTSGYGSYQIWKDYGEELRVLPGLDYVVEKIAENQPAKAVGVEQYSSLNTILLAAIIKKATGMEAEIYLKKTILEPLNMEDTYLLDEPKEEWLSHVPTTYQIQSEGPKTYWTPGKDSSMYPFFRGATGAASTATDYAKFIQMWLNGGELNGSRILKKSTVEMALNNKGKSIGLHWFVPEGPKAGNFPGVFGHTGWYGTSAMAFPKDSAIVIYLTQTHNAPQIAEINNLIAKSGIFQHKGPYDLNMYLPKLPAQPKEDVLNKFTGKYYTTTPDSLVWEAIIEIKNQHLICNISSIATQWTDELVYLNNTRLAPGYMFGNQPRGIFQKVYYDFSKESKFDIVVEERIEMSFKKK